MPSDVRQHILVVLLLSEVITMLHSIVFCRLSHDKSVYLQKTILNMGNIGINEILRKLNVSSLTAMQQTTIEEYRKGTDLVLLSPTGSGKTLAYLIPLVQSLAADEVLQAVVLVPSRELALQIEQVFKSMGSGVPVMSCYGGRPAMDEHRTMNSLHPRVIFATPGRMNDHLDKENIAVSGVHTLVIDEFDKCLEMGFQDEMARVIGRFPNLKKRFLLSATDAPAIPDFVSGRDFVKLDFLSGEEQIPDRIRVYTVDSPEKDKLSTLNRLLCGLGDKSSLVFVNYRESVERVYNYLKREGFACAMFHGGMEQRERERALYRFSNGSCNVFVSTDLAARGLDIPNIDSVIHYHLPLNEDAYIHRNGRTARWDAEGCAYIILHAGEHLPEYIVCEPEAYIPSSDCAVPSAPRWVTLYIGKGKKDKINKVDVVGFLSKVGGLQKDEIGRVDVKDHYAFAAVRRNKLKDVLRAVAGQKIKGIRTIVEEIR